MPGGTERALHAIQLSSELHGPDAVVCSIDIRNAFNSCSRAAIAQCLYATPQLRPIWRLFNWAYHDPSSLLVYNASLSATLESSEGVRQGDFLASLLFALCLQPTYEACLNVGRLHGSIHAFAIQDDLTFVGSPAAVFAALTN